MGIPNLSVISVVDHLRSFAERSTGPVVVALDGRSGSGKSTIAASIQARLDGAQVIDGDDFYCGGVELRLEPIGTLANLCIDWRAQHRVLEAVREGREGVYHAFDWETFDGSRHAAESRVAPSRYILLEGTYSARPELGSLIDLRFIVEVDDETRIHRLLERDGGIGPWERQWIDAEVHYFSHLPDLVRIDGMIHGGSARSG